MSAVSLFRRTTLPVAQFDPVLVLPLIVVVGLLAAWLGLSSDADPARVAVDLAVAWSFGAAAAVALDRPGLRRSGLLMFAAGLTLFFPYLEFADWAPAYTLGYLLENVWQFFWAWLVLSYPRGRLWSPTARVLVVATAVATVGAQLVSAGTLDDPRNLLLIKADQAFTELVWRGASALGLAIVLAALVLIALRLLRLRGVRLRISLPLLVGATLSLLLTGVRLAVNAAGDFVLHDRLGTVDQLLAILVPIGFFVGLLWSRMRSSEVTSLVVELRAGGAETLRERLARALGDPSLELVYWLDQSGGYVDSAGKPVELPQTSDRAATQVVAAGAPVAALIHDPALLDDPDLVESVRATAGLILENERLAAEVRAQLAEVRASRARLMTAADDERRRLERDLHDGAQQRLVGLALKLRLAQAGADPAAGGVLEQAQDDLELALSELREFARGVHPSILREDGLDAAVEALARRAPIPVEVEGQVGERLPDTVELAAYFFVSEALTNVAKHAGASYAAVNLERPNGMLRVSVHDDGVGGADMSRGTGLGGLADRLSALDGSLRIESEHGHGTMLVAEIPCEL